MTGVHAGLFEAPATLALWLCAILRTPVAHLVPHHPVASFSISYNGMWQPSVCMHGLNPHLQ
jgi:hypothetical protein